MDDDFDILCLAIESVESEAVKTNGSTGTINSSPIDAKLDEFYNETTEIQTSKSQENSAKKNSRHLVGVDLCFEDNSLVNTITPENIPVKKKNIDCLFSDKSLVHTGDTDSSDDEDNKYFEERKYDSCGKFIKNQLKNTGNQPVKFHESSWKKNVSSPSISYFSTPTPSSSSLPTTSTSSSSTTSTTSLSSPTFKVPLKESKIDVTADPIFGIRIVNPLVSSQVIKEKMVGRTPISLAKVKSHVSHGDLNNDWVISGVIAQKLPPRVSQNGNTYSSWIISDLKHDLKSIFLFLFGKSHQELWKTPVGTVLAILNPSVLSDNKSSEYEAKLSIKSSDQVMIWGKSKELGHCRSKKKNGESCGKFVNLYLCEYCVYHVKQEYSKCKARPVFSSESNVNLRNKVLGKNEVFYGGKSFSSVQSSGQKKRMSFVDNMRLKGLGTTIIEPPEIVSIPNLQRSNEILKLLPPINSPLSKSKSNDKNRLTALTPKNTKKDTEHISTTKRNSTRSGIKPHIVSTDEGVSKSVAEIKLPTLSNPENEFKKSNDKLLATKENSAVNNYFAHAPAYNGATKKSKINLQKRFNGLINLQSEIKDTLTKCESNGEPMFSTSKKGPMGNPKSLQDLSNSTPELTLSHKRISRMEKPTKSICDESIVSEDQSSDFKTRFICETVSNNKQIAESSPSSAYIKTQSLTTTNTSNTPMSKAKMKALMYVKNRGPISKENANKLKTGVKRPFPTEDNGVEDKKSVLSERFIQLMNQKSLHEDLIELREHEQQMEYFERMEKKDRLEEKMSSTYKVDCKAVKCTKCNYLWFSASESCKAEGHPIKVVDAVKRFFKCGKCSNRTVSLTIIPLIPCKKCYSSSWVRTAMMREKIAKNDTLSIRGGEQKYVNSVITNSSLNLLVPDD